MKILVVEDDAKIASFLKKGLEEEFFCVDRSSTLLEELAKAHEGKVSHWAKKGFIFMEFPILWHQMHKNMFLLFFILGMKIVKSSPTLPIKNRTTFHTTIFFTRC